MFRLTVCRLLCLDVINLFYRCCFQILSACVISVSLLCHNINLVYMTLCIWLFCVVTNNNSVYFEWTLRMQPHDFALTKETKLRKKKKVAHSFNLFSTKKAQKSTELALTEYYLKRKQTPKHVVEIGWRYATRPCDSKAPRRLSIFSYRLWWGAVCQYELQCNHTASPPTGTVSDTSLSFIIRVDRWRGVCWLTPTLAETFNCSNRLVRLIFRCWDSLVNSKTADLVQKH